MGSPVPKFAEALGMLRHINRIVSDDPALWRIFASGKYNYLQMHQFGIFGDAREFYERGAAGSGGERPSRVFFMVRLQFLRCLALGVSLIAIARLLIMRPRVLLYSPDKANPTHDFRIAGLYEYLSARRIAYMEVFHTTIGQGFYSNLKKRGRYAIYLEAFDPLFSLADIFRAEPIELSRLDDSLASRLICRAVQRARRSEFRIRLFAFILKLSGVRTFLAIDDPRNYLFELVAACKAAGITTHAFQHGAYCKYVVGWIDGSGGRASVVAPDKLYVWSAYWRRELARLGSFMPQSDIEFASNPKSLRPSSSSTGSSRESHEGTNVLMPYETAIPKDEVWSCVRRLLECPGVTVYFKPRPDKSIKDQLAEYSIPAVLPSRFVIQADLKAVLPRIDFVIGVQTTLLYEMVESLKRAVLIKSTFDYSEGMTFNGIADLLDPADDVCVRAKELSVISAGALEQRKHLLTEGGVPLEGVLDGIFSYVRH